MAWIESHQELARHPKTRRLARLLGISVPTAIGHLHLLWWWALDFAQTGDLSRYDAADIADAAVYDGDPDQFVTAMIEAGFIDRLEDGRLQLHDWMEYAGRLIGKRQEEAERRRQLRTAYDSGVINAVRQRDGNKCRYCGKTVDWGNRKGPDGGTYDHVNPALPASVGNLVVACRACSTRKGNRTPEEAGMRLLPVVSTDGGQGAEKRGSDTRQIGSDTYQMGSNTDQIGSNTEQIGSDTNPPTVTVPYPNRTVTVLVDSSSLAGTTCTQPPTPAANEKTEEGPEQTTDELAERRLLEAYWSVFGCCPSGLIQEELRKWLQRFGPELMIEALRRTAAENTRSWRYTSAILQNWADANVKTMDDVARLDAEHERTKEAKWNGARARSPSTATYVEGGYDWDRLAE